MGFSGCPCKRLSHCYYICSWTGYGFLEKSIIMSRQDWIHRSQCVVKFRHPAVLLALPGVRDHVVLGQGVFDGGASATGIFSQSSFFLFLCTEEQQIYVASFLHSHPHRDTQDSDAFPCKDKSVGGGWSVHLLSPSLSNRLEVFFLMSEGDINLRLDTSASTMTRDWFSARRSSLTKGIRC